MATLANANISNSDNNLSLLQMIMKNKQGKGKRTSSGSSGAIKSTMVDTVSISTAIQTTVNASININMSATTTTTGRVDLIGSSHINSQTKMMPLSQYSPRAVSGEHYLSKAMPPAMSEEEFDQAIKELATKDALAGNYNNSGNKEIIRLGDAYVSVVSPDRAGTIAAASKTARVPADLDYNMAKVYDDNGREVAYYNHQNGWCNICTKEEKDRNNLFWNKYNKAFNEALDDNQISGPRLRVDNSMDVSA